MAVLDHPPIRVTCTPTLGAVVVGLEGELGAESASVVRERLGDLILAGRVRTIVVDVQHLGFVDSTGLGVLAGASRRIREAGGDLVLSAPTPAVVRAIEVSGMASAFTITRA